MRLAPATHPYLVRLHGNFCRALAEQAARTRDRALLDEAVTAARRASERARPGEEASVARVLLVKCLAQRAKDAADPASLRELIDAGRSSQPAGRCGRGGQSGGWPRPTPGPSTTGSAATGPA